LCNATYTAAIGKHHTSFENAGLRPQQEEGLWTNVAEVLATRFVLFNQTAAIRRAVLERLGTFDEGLKYLEDYDLTLRLAAEGPWAFIRPPLVTYRLGTANSCAQKSAGDPTLLKEYEIAILERALAAAESSGVPRLHRLLQSRLKRARRLMFSAKLGRSSSAAGQGVGALLRGIENIREKAFRRSPWYPKAETAPLN
jgi:GT2 family glycosyltransferase